MKKKKDEQLSPNVEKLNLITSNDSLDDDEKSRSKRSRSKVVDPSRMSPLVSSDSLDEEKAFLDDVLDSRDKEGFSISEAISAIGFGKQQWQLLLFCGTCWAADAFEMMLLAFLLPAVRHEWSATPFWEATVAGASFAGMLIGAPTWGFVSDTYGRRVAFMIGSVITAIFGFFSAFAPSLWTLVLARALVGFGVSSSHVAFSLFAEFLPVEKRGICLILIEAFWTFGTVAEAGLAWIVLPTLGWRWLLGISALPMFALLLFYPLIPESPRYLLQNGKHEKALYILTKAANNNGKKLPSGQLILPKSDVTDKTQYLFMQLFSPDLRKTTLFLWVIWFANTFAYYGVVLLTPEYFNTHGSSDDAEQQMFMSVFITSLAEFPGLLLSAYLVDKTGRRMTQFLFFAGCGAFTLLLIIRQSFAFSTFCAICARLSIAGAFATTYLYTPEAYPTRIRSTGLGICSAFSRIAALLTPYVVEMFLGYGIYIPLTIYAVVSFIAAGTSLLLVETAKQDLK